MHVRSSLAASVLACIVASALVGCTDTTAPESSAVQSNEQSSTATAAPVALSIAGPVSPPSVPMLKMVEDQVLGDSATLEFSPWSTADELTGYITGGYDFVAAPLTTGATLYTKGMPIKQLNVSAWDVMGLLTTDDSITTVDDLEGETITVAMKGSAVDYTTQVILRAHGLIPGDNVTLDYVAATEGVPQLLSGQTSILVTVQPQVTAVLAQASNARSIIDFQKEWEEVTAEDEPLPTAGVLVAASLAEDHPELVTQFEEEYAKAAQWVAENPAEAAALTEKYLGMDAAVFEPAIPHINWMVKDAQGAKPAVKLYFDTLFAFSPEAVGGEIPGAEFYFSGR